MGNHGDYFADLFDTGRISWLLEPKSFFFNLFRGVKWPHRPHRHTPTTNYGKRRLLPFSLVVRIYIAYEHFQDGFQYYLLKRGEETIDRVEQLS